MKPNQELTDAACTCIANNKALKMLKILQKDKRGEIMRYTRGT